MTNMPQNHVWVKVPFKVQDKLVDFNVTIYVKFIEKVSGSTMQLSLRKVVKFECGVKE